MGSFESPPDLLGKWWLQWLMMGMTRGIGFECMDPGMVWQMVVLVTGVPCLSCALVLSMVKCGTVEDAQPGGGHGQGCERCARPTWTPPVPSIRPLIHQPLIGIIFLPMKIVDAEIISILTERIHYTNATGSPWPLGDYFGSALSAHLSSKWPSLELLLFKIQ